MARWQAGVELVELIPYDVINKIVVFAVIVAATAIIAKVLSLLIRGAFKTWVPAVRTNVQRVVSISIWVGGLIFAIEQLGLRTDLFLLILGLLGVATLLAIKDTLENIGAKYFSDVYVPFKVGDIIRVGNSAGKVIEINPITTVLLTDDKRLVSVPNTAFVREKVVNMTPRIWKEILVPIAINGTIDLPEFESEVLKACHKMRRYLDARFPPVLTVKGRGKRYVNLVLTLMVKDSSKKNEIISNVNQKISEIEDKMMRGRKSRK